MQAYSKNNTILTQGNLKYILINLCIVCLVLAYSSQTAAQTVAYSQYHLSPMQTNPAMVGSYNQPFAMMSYRQVSLGSGFPASNAAFETPMVSLIYPLKSKKRGRLGGTGFSVINDRAGGGGMLQTTGLKATFAYNLRLGQTNFLSMGIQGGYFWQNINATRLTTGTQWIDGQYLGEIDNNETIGVTPTSFLTTSTGLYWYMTKSDSSTQVKAYVGISGQNINQPNTSFSNNPNDKLPATLVITGGVTVFDNQTLRVMPNLRWIEHLGQSRQINAGTLLWYQLGNQNEEEDKPRTNVGMGLWYNSHGIANVSFEFNQPHYMIALGYGFAASKNAPQLNTFEVKLGLKIGKSYTKSDYDPVAKHEEKLRKREEKRRKREEKRKQQEKDKEEPKDSVPAVKPPKQIKEQHLEILDGSVFFGYNKKELLNSSKAFLNQVVNILEKYPEIELEVQGHTCKITQSEDKNYKLSVTRAEIVKDYLVQHGVDANRLNIKAFGSTKPRGSNHDKAGQLRNRRVQFRITKK